jgi:hypothetical protein
LAPRGAAKSRVPDLPVSASQLVWRFFLVQLLLIGLLPVPIESALAAQLAPIELALEEPLPGE